MFKECIRDIIYSCIATKDYTTLCNIYMLRMHGRERLVELAIDLMGLILRKTGQEDGLEVAEELSPLDQEGASRLSDIVEGRVESWQVVVDVASLCSLDELSQESA